MSFSIEDSSIRVRSIATKAIDDYVCSVLSVAIGEPVTLRVAMDLAHSQRVMMRRYASQKLTEILLDGKVVGQYLDPEVQFEGLKVTVSMQHSGKMS